MFAKWRTTTLFTEKSTTLFTENSTTLFRVQYSIVCKVQYNIVHRVQCNIVHGGQFVLMKYECSTAYRLQPQCTAYHSALDWMTNLQYVGKHMKPCGRITISSFIFSHYQRGQPYQFFNGSYVMCLSHTRTSINNLVGTRKNRRQRVPHMPIKDTTHQRTGQEAICKRTVKKQNG